MKTLKRIVVAVTLSLAAACDGGADDGNKSCTSCRSPDIHRVDSLDALAGTSLVSLSWTIPSGATGVMIRRDTVDSGDRVRR